MENRIRGRDWLDFGDVMKIKYTNVVRDGY